MIPQTVAFTDSYFDRYIQNKEENTVKNTLFFLKHFCQPHAVLHINVVREVQTFLAHVIGKRKGLQEPLQLLSTHTIIDYRVFHALKSLLIRCSPKENEADFTPSWPYFSATIINKFSLFPQRTKLHQLKIQNVTIHPLPIKQHTYPKTLFHII